MSVIVLAVVSRIAHLETSTLLLGIIIFLMVILMVFASVAKSVVFLPEHNGNIQRKTSIKLIGFLMKNSPWLALIISFLLQINIEENTLRLQLVLDSVGVKNIVLTFFIVFEFYVLSWYFNLIYRYI
ncbi:MAG TPA: hypothetical protein DEP18_04520 [Flavobacteriales bacterium]|nr:hypothetical protein [Flavobacteriales bacterium]HRE74251.1 hypothetical protein [Flavobacteriales bacterium]